MRRAWSSSVRSASVSITGPISVASHAGLPTTSSCMAPASISMTLIGDVLLHEQHAQRRAALPGTEKGAGDHVFDHLLGQSRTVDQHGVLAAGFRHQCSQRRIARSQAGLIRRAVSVEPVKATPLIRGCRDRPAPMVAPSPGSNCNAARGIPASCRRSTATPGNQWRLLGRLGQHRVARRQRSADLADKNRQREIPRADAGKHTPPMQATAGWSRR